MQAWPPQREGEPSDDQDDGELAEVGVSLYKGFRVSAFCWNSIIKQIREFFHGISTGCRVPCTRVGARLLPGVKNYCHDHPPGCCYVPVYREIHASRTRSLHDIM